MAATSDGMILPASEKGVEKKSFPFTAFGARIMPTCNQPRAGMSALEPVFCLSTPISVGRFLPDIR
jgi:hypothetical protein